MRASFHTLIALFALSLGGGPALAASFANWSPPPAGTDALLLLTGADGNFVRPKACFKGVGGSFYRPAFSKWLAKDPSHPPFAWVSTGNVFSRVEESGMAEDDEILTNLEATGFAAIGAGSEDLEVLGLPWNEQAERLDELPWLATNLRVLETGRPALPGSRLLKVGHQEVAILAVTEHIPGRILGDLSTGSIVTVDPLEAIEAEIASWEKRPDFVLVLAPLLQGSVRQLAAELEGVDLIVASAALRAHPDVRLEGKNRVLWVGGWGRYLGRVALDEEGEPLAFDVVEVGHEFPIDPTTGQPHEAGPSS